MELYFPARADWSSWSLTTDPHYGRFRALELHVADQDFGSPVEWSLIHTNSVTTYKYSYMIVPVFTIFSTDRFHKATPIGCSSWVCRRAVDQRMEETRIPLTGSGLECEQASVFKLLSNAHLACKRHYLAKVAEELAIA